MDLKKKSSKKILMRNYLVFIQYILNVWKLIGFINHKGTLLASSSAENL